MTAAAEATIAAANAAANAPSAAKAAGRSAGERPLTDSEHDRFEDMLRTLTVERGDVREAMVFAMDNADAAAEVVDTLAEALSLQETPLPLKVGSFKQSSQAWHLNEENHIWALSFVCLLL